MREGDRGWENKVGYDWMNKKDKMRMIEGDETISTTPICLVFASRDKEESYKKEMG